MFSLKVGKGGLALRKSKGQVSTDTGVLVWDADDVSSQCLESIGMSVSDWKARATSIPPTSWTLFSSYETVLWRL